MSQQHGHKTTGKFRDQQQATGQPSASCPRLMGEGGFVKHGNMSHLTHGARMGYSKKVGKSCK